MRPLRVLRPPRSSSRLRISLFVAAALAFVGCDSATDPGDGSQANPPEPRIVYSAYSDEEPEGALYSARLDGSDTRLLISGRGVAGLDVSPDGERVAYDDYEGFDDGHDVFVLDLVAGKEERLTHGADWNLAPVWSPDGTRLAFTAQRGGVFGVSVMDADGTNERRISGSVSAGAPAWSSAGDRIAYSITDFPRRVVVSDLEGNVQREIADDWANSLDWSNDDAYLLAIGVTDRNGNGGIVRLAADGSDALSLTPTSAGEHGRARWSPDGEEILFEKYDREARRWRLYLMDADGSDEREIPLPDGFTGAADWRLL